MCSFCQSVTLNQSGKEEFKGESLQCPGKAWGLVEKGNAETKGEEERKITTALRFRGMNGIDDSLRGINGLRERGGNNVPVVA